MAEFWQDPLFKIGAGILAASEPGVPGATAIGKGLFNAIGGLDRAHSDTRRLDIAAADQKADAEYKRNALEYQRAQIAGTLQNRNQKIQERMAAVQTATQMANALPPGPMREQLAMGAQINPQAVASQIYQIQQSQLQRQIENQQPLSKTDIIGIENQLGDDFRSETKGFKGLSDSFGTFRASEDTPAGDIARVFAFMKMLDPTSSVLEGEQATVRNAGGASDALRNMYNSLLGGGSLNPDMRRQLASQAASVYNNALVGYQQIANRYRNQASGYGVGTGFMPKPRKQAIVEPAIGETVPGSTGGVRSTTRIK